MNTQSEFLKLTLPNNVAYLKFAHFCANELAAMIGFDPRARQKIELALEEAAATVIENAFEPGESGTFDVIFQRIPMGMEIILKDQGLPFDPGRIPEFKPNELMADNAEMGLGLFLMKENMDRVSFLNLGMEGKELHLVKFLPNKSIEEYFPASELQPVPDTPPAEPAVIQEKIEYDVRELYPSEAVEVSKCAYKSHGYTFFDEHIYYPDRLIELNESGQMISAVAVTKNNVFMGHSALVFPYPKAKIAEFTFVFVNVEYRGQGCMNRLCDYLFNGPRIGSLAGIYAYAVTNHIFTQKAMVKYEFHDCGILLATSPATWKFKGMAESKQRISVVLSFKYLHPPKALTLYPPAHHRAMMEELYLNVKAHHQFAIPPVSAPHLPAQNSVIQTDLNGAESCGEIHVMAYGDHVVSEVKQILRDLCLKQIACINLFLNLEDPATYFLTSEFERLGFFFAGILPQAGVGEALILQYLNNVAFDYREVVAYTEVAKRLLAYIQDRDPNATP
jgi:anti-sigma regulatory factor (Ser/Thr protein kinase)